MGIKGLITPGIEKSISLESGEDVHVHGELSWLHLVGARLVLLVGGLGYVDCSSVISHPRQKYITTTSACAYTLY